MSYRTYIYFLVIQIFVLLYLSLDTVKTRWQLSQEFENQEYLKITLNKLLEINLHLKTEHYHLNSPAKIERHAKENLGMIEIKKDYSIVYEN